jgi:hypothetical protein
VQQFHEQASAAWSQLVSEVQEGLQEQVGERQIQLITAQSKQPGTVWPLAASCVGADGQRQT